MPLTDKKISASEYTGNDIAGLSNTPSADGMGASTLKARFDALIKLVLIPKYNQLIDMLVSVTTGSSGSRQIGFDATTEIPYQDVHSAIVGVEAVKVNTTTMNTLLAVDKFKITPEGGIAVSLINQTGGVSVKGYAVTPSDTIDNAVRNIVVDVPNPIGIVYESGVAVGQPMWVVVSGIAEAYFQNAPTRSYLARGFVGNDTGYVAGQLKSEALPTSPFATDKHFYELGHILETKGVAGLAKIVLHFN